MLWQFYTLQVLNGNYFSCRLSLSGTSLLHILKTACSKLDSGFSSIHHPSVFLTKIKLNSIDRISTFNTKYYTTRHLIIHFMPTL